MSSASVFKNDEARKRVLDEYEAVLARWPLPLERFRIGTASAETAVLAFGPGATSKTGNPPLVLLHGTGSNSSMWVGDAAALGEGRRIFALDIPGEPGLSEERRLDWQGRGSADWLGEAVAALGLGGGSAPYDLLGLSLGGWIGLGHAAGGPAGLRSLALLCPSGIGRTRPSFTWKAIAASILLGPRAAGTITRWLYGDEEPHPEAVRVGSLVAAATNPRFEAPRLYTDAELRAISARVFLAVGGKDALLRSGESATRLARLLPDAEIRLLHGKGHALAGLGPMVADFLDRA